MISSEACLKSKNLYQPSPIVSGMHFWFWRSHCQSLNRLVLRQGIQADTGGLDKPRAIEARLDVIERRLNEVSKQ